MTHPEDVIVRWTPAHGPSRRLRFRPRTDGGYWRCTETWAGCHWRETGRESVADLCIDAPDAAPVLTYESTPHD